MQQPTFVGPGRLVWEDVAPPQLSGATVPWAEAEADAAPAGLDAKTVVVR